MLEQKVQIIKGLLLPIVVVPRIDRPTCPHADLAARRLARVGTRRLHLRRVKAHLQNVGRTGITKQLPESQVLFSISRCYVTLILTFEAAAQ